MIANAKAPDTTFVLNELVKQISVSAMESFSGQTGFARADYKNKRVVKDHWMAQVVVSGSGLRLYFQFFFSATVVKTWANDVYKGNEEKMPLDQIHDFAKEYCNLVGGRLKKSVVQSGHKVGVSLPVVSRGFDRVFISPSDLKNCITDDWVLSRDNRSAVCSTEIEVTNKFVLDSSVLHDDDTGEIRLL